MLALVTDLLPVFVLMTASRISLRSILGWASVVGLLTFPLLSVSGAVDMFLKIDGIKGESRDKINKDSIDVLSWSWGMSNAGGSKTGGKGGKPNVQEISLTKYFDISSPALMLSTLKGTRHPKAVLSVIKRGGDTSKANEFLVITLNDVQVTSLSSGGSSDEDRFTENVTLDFTSFKLDYIPTDQKGKAADKVSVKYDISTNKAE